jgi:hypothetical protein
LRAAGLAYADHHGAFVVAVQSNGDGRGKASELTGHW